jgi:tetratricopeptide (TPR) repeat protein
MTEAARDLAQASALLDVKRYSQAVSLLARIVAADPADSRAWCLFAAAHLGSGQYQEAAASASRAVMLAPSDDWPYRLVSSTQRHLGNVSAALTAANEACKLAPYEWRAYICLAQAYLATEVDFHAAERAVADALRLAPGEPEVHFIAGKVSFAQERWKAARVHQEHVLALDPAHSGALNELGRVRLHRANHAGAARHFVQAAQSAPGVSAYGHNVDVVVRRVVALTIYMASTASLALYLTMIARPARVVLVIGYVVVILFSAGFGAVQLWRMPRATRPLFRTRRVALAMGAVYGAIFIAVIVAVVTPTAALSGALLAVTALIVASRLVAYAVLRRRRAAPPTKPRPC